jgi:bifunctional non-homologous end joining protein LigD
MQQTLYYREGASDKVYQVAIEPQQNQFVVNFAYGRRGATLQTGTKTQSPVDHTRAVSIFTKLVTEKKAKGYTEGEEGTPYQHSDKQASGIQCQLLNPVGEEELKALIVDTDYGAQEKYDGRRLLVCKEGAEIQGINRQGIIVGLPSLIVQSAHRCPGNFILDGEAVGDVLHAFDLLKLNGRDLRPLPYSERCLALLNLMAAYKSDHKIHHIQLAPTYTTPACKARLLEDLKSQGKEGIVFKRWDAPYTAGRPNSGGSQLKHKFYATVSAVVAKINAQRSVELKLMNGMGWVNAGNVTIPANHHIPQSGAVVEIRYLYAFRASGCLYQPTYLGQRDDVVVGDCKTAHLKYKAGEEEAP